MAATVHLLVWSFSLLHFTPLIFSYKISTVDSPGVCNETIYLEEGAKSAAILRLTAKDFYDTTPMRCIITFKAVHHRWSGLTGVLEEVDLRRYEDKSDHHFARDQCVDYIKVLQDNAVPQEEQCGSWSVSGSDKLTYIGFRRSLFGYCQNPPAPGSGISCGVSELKVEVAIGHRDFNGLRRGKPWRSHRGFTFVVTAYRYSFGESGCDDGLKSCRKTDYHGYQQHCVHKSLWCDHHINCGQPENNDELLCRDEKMLSGLVTVMVGPWVGAALLVVMLLSAILYWRRARPPPPQGPPQPQDHNSYAESYEVSSTMSSAHHMAIQVRVVCNAGHTPRLSPWQAADLPPSYDSLFPQGPPPPKSATTSTTTVTTTSAASFNISTTSLVSSSLGSNANATAGPSGFYSNTTQTSSIVIPISAICSTLGSPVMSSASFNTTSYTNTVTSVTSTITNTTRSTTTIGALETSSPSALTSISVTSVSHAGPSNSLMASRNKDNNTISPSHESRSSNSSRAPTPNSSAKTDIKENSSCMGEVIPPLVEPEDTNITPSNSAGDTPALVDVQLPYIFQDTTQHNVNTDNEFHDPSVIQSCDKLSLSPRSKNAQQDLENESTADEEAMRRPDTLSASCTGSYDFETSDRPDSESEETEEITLEDEDASKSGIIRNSDEELNAEFSNTSLANFNEGSAYASETTRPLLLREREIDGMTHESSLDKDDESLL